MKNYYKEKYWEYTNDELKDIIAGRFHTPTDEEVAAVIELLHDRNQESFNEAPHNLSISDIPSANMSVLLEIVKNPSIWGEKIVEKAEAEILRREHSPSNQESPQDSTKKTLMQTFLAIIGVIVSVLLVKLIAMMFLFFFLFYCVISCLNDL